jgi:hypothetical protein
MMYNGARIVKDASFLPGVTCVSDGLAVASLVFKGRQWLILVATVVMLSGLR